jgi:predicted nuclease of restriction endonuclease-like (RecB) superfamily
LTDQLAIFILRAIKIGNPSIHMKKSSKQITLAKKDVALLGYDTILSSIVELLESARLASARSINTIITATYWEIGRRIVQFEQGGRKRAEYGEELLKRLSQDLTKRFGRGFGRSNLFQMRAFYSTYPQAAQMAATQSGKSQKQKIQTASGKSSLIQSRAVSEPDVSSVAGQFPLSWSHYVVLLSLKNPHARDFYETEALRNGWSVRQLNRQINTSFYERTALSRNKAAMLTKGGKQKSEDSVTPEEEIKDPFVLEFLGLKDEYSENELEAALIQHLEVFLLELGGDFAFVGRQKRLRIGDQWFRVDLLFFHRRLRCLIIIELKLDEFTHADAGQMHMYLNYARHHWTHPDENPPVGLILCAKKNAAVARYALEGLPNKVLAAEYRTTLPDEEILAAELEQTRNTLEGRKAIEVKVKRKPGRK